jgi:hypothetical protein
MNEITNEERLNLKKLMNNENYQDNTEYIRKVKHSVKIRDDIRKLDTFKNQNNNLKETNPPEYLEKCKELCNFLYTNYTDIFNRIIKDELDMSIMTQLLSVLKMIEDGNIDQNDGSILVGKILKNLYLDSAMKCADNLDKKYSNETAPAETFDNQISWKDYKKCVITNKQT